jgi:hypothetical protein
VGVERTFFLASPRLEKVEVLRHGRVRRANLYYLRKVSGKAAQLKEKRGLKALEGGAEAEAAEMEAAAEAAVAEMETEAESPVAERKVDAKAAPKSQIERHQAVAEVAGPEGEKPV